MSGLGTTVVFMYYVSAARADADPDQLARLRAEVLPLLGEVYRQTGDEQPVRSKILEILGGDWAPSGEWAEAIEKLSGG